MVRHGSEAREEDPERRAASGTGALRLDAPLVQLDQALHQREAQTEAALTAIERALSLNEKIEHARQQLRVDALAVVLHLDHSLAFAGGRDDLDAPTFGRVLGRIVEQVPDDLRQ